MSGESKRMKFMIEEHLQFFNFGFVDMQLEIKESIHENILILQQYNDDDVLGNLGLSLKQALQGQTKPISELLNGEDSE